MSAACASWSPPPPTRRARRRSTRVQRRSMRARCRAVRRRILSARQILLRHPWAPGLLEARASTSQAVLRYYDGLLGLLRDGGFSYDLAHHALHVLGSRALGFAQ